MIAALIPAPLPRAHPPRPPLPHLPALPAGPDQVEPHLNLGRLDPSGRISARLLLHLLGWPPGHRVTFDTTRSVITATSGPAERHTIGATGLLAIPSAIQQLCHLTAGDAVVLLADPGRDLLPIHPARTVAQFLVSRAVRRGRWHLTANGSTPPGPLSTSSASPSPTYSATPDQRCRPSTTTFRRCSPRPAPARCAPTAATGRA
ncbi:hypothetical protein [Dactylosporangium sp. NPDC006015]|uniref:hypothetical protein n=1 Tax=Dactylosporangium sp. NPDC006015 TaxID=3154576 RepID=UPI0033A8D1DE